MYKMQAHFLSKLSVSFQLTFFTHFRQCTCSASSWLPKPLTSVPHSCLVSLLPIMLVPRFRTWNTCMQNLSAGCQKEDHLINSICIHIRTAHRFFTLKTSALLRGLPHSLVILPPVRFKIVNLEESESLEYFQRRGMCPRDACQLLSLCEESVIHTRGACCIHFITLSSNIFFSSLCCYRELNSPREDKCQCCDLHLITGLVLFPILKFTLQAKSLKTFFFFSF